MRATRWRPRMAAALWVLTLAAALAALIQVRVPDPIDSDPAVAGAFAVVRALGIALGGYVLIVITAGALARAARLPRLIAAVDAVTVPSLRRMLAGATIASSVLTGPLNGVAHAETRPPSVPPVMVVEPVTPTAVSTTTSTAPLPVDETPAPVLHRLPDDPPPQSPPTPYEVVARAGDYTVEPGDNFWAIADATLAAAWGRPPNATETAPYWRTLVDANRSRLAPPGNANLIYAGQHFELPAPPRAPG